MELSHIEHLGIAVKSLEEAIPYYENILGLKCYAIEEVADQKVKTAFFKVGQTKIELLESTTKKKGWKIALIIFLCIVLLVGIVTYLNWNTKYFIIIIRN